MMLGFHLLGYNCSWTARYSFKKHFNVTNLRALITLEAYYIAFLSEACHKVSILHFEWGITVTVEMFISWLLYPLNQLWGKSHLLNIIQGLLLTFIKIISTKFDLRSDLSLV